MTKDKSQQPMPVGVTQWKKHGKKYGYWKYFEDKARSEERERIAKLRFISVQSNTVTIEFENKIIDDFKEQIEISNKLTDAKHEGVCK